MTDMRAESTTNPTRLPGLYIGHGAPPLLDDPLWTAQLKAIAAGMARPTAILVVSAHWERAPISLSATDAATPLVYDFSGFDRRYYEMTYQTPDASALARQVAALMPDTEPVHQHNRRGLDHGAWVPMKVMYPDASIPVLQLSIPTHDPLKLLDLGRRLRPLRDQGVLIVGSGFMTHGLPFLRDWSIDATPPGWSVEFDHWALDALDRGDIDTLASFENAPGMPYAHPTVDHFLPLFITLGLADRVDEAPEQIVDGFWIGLSKRSFQVN